MVVLHKAMTKKLDERLKIVVVIILKWRINHLIEFSLLSLYYCKAFILQYKVPCCENWAKLNWTELNMHQLSSVWSSMQDREKDGGSVQTTLEELVSDLKAVESLVTKNTTGSDWNILAPVRSLCSRRHIYSLLPVNI